MKYSVVNVKSISPELKADLRNLYDVCIDRASKSKSSRAKCAAAALMVNGKILACENYAIGDKGEIVERGHTVNWMHAEQGLAALAANKGHILYDSLVMTLEAPCQNCLKMLAACGVRRVYFVRNYHAKAHGKEFVSEVLAKRLFVKQIDEAFLKNEIGYATEK